MYKSDSFFIFGTLSGTLFNQAFEEWLSQMGDIQIISHSIAVDIDGDHIVTVIYKG